METRRVIAPPKTQRRTAPGEHAGACHRRWTWILPEIICCRSGRRHVSSEYPSARRLSFDAGECFSGFVNECAQRRRRLCARRIAGVECSQAAWAAADADHAFANLSAYARNIALRSSSAPCVAGTMIGAPSLANAWHCSTYGRSLS
jgi:hypothetical protein